MIRHDDQRGAGDGRMAGRFEGGQIDRHALHRAAQHLSHQPRRGPDPHVAMGLTQCPACVVTVACVTPSRQRPLGEVAAENVTVYAAADRVHVSNRVEAAVQRPRGLKRERPGREIGKHLVEIREPRGQ